MGDSPPKGDKRKRAIALPAAKVAVEGTLNVNFAPERPAGLGTLPPPPFVNVSASAGRSKSPSPFQSIQPCSTAFPPVMFIASTMIVAVVPGTNGVVSIIPFSSSPGGVEIPKVTRPASPSSLLAAPIEPAIGSGRPSISASTDAPSFRSFVTMCFGGLSLPFVL